MDQTIIVAGALAQRPGVGGHTWVFLQYLLGFRRLGWEVLFLDRLSSTVSVDAAGQPCTIDTSENLRYFRAVMDRFGLGDSYAILCDGETRTIGVPRREVLERVRGSACLLNVMGFVGDGEILAAAQRRVFLDIDPGFPQMWCDLGLHDAFAGHTDFVTVGRNIGQETCAIPTCGRHWVTTLPPVVLEHWPATPVPGGLFTSVGAWRGPNRPIEYKGQTYGLRVHEFRKFIELPWWAGRRFELAMDIHPAETKDLSLLRENGWRLADPRAAAGDPWAYREYLKASTGEFMVAKNMYVQSHSGWFSDRSACYLASGRPVLAQDTGLRQYFPAHDGLLLFSSPEEAVEGVRAIDADPQRHGRGARAMAEEHFDSDIVLGKLLHDLGIERMKVRP